MKLRNALMAALLSLSVLFSLSVQADVTLLNVSYDPTRELYQASKNC